MSLQIRRFALLLFLSVLCSAQDRGTIRGTVTDQTGAAVPDATVTARNANTGLIQTVPTGADGVYNILYLPVGSYSVLTEKTGFRKSEMTAVTVNVNTVVSVNVQLTIGAVDQSIEVTTAAPLLETAGTNLGKVVPTKAIMDLPLFISGGVRSTMSFIILTPGVVGSQADPRIGGGLTSGQSEMLDGAEAQSERRNDTQMRGVSVEALEEFKVQTGAYSAEYGRTSNGVINFVTKSGTNELHGSAFTFMRNEFFNARGYTFTPTVRPVRRQWNPGGSIGGPIVIPKVFDGHNKAFFFFAYEQSYTKNGRSTSLVTVPIDEFRRGDMRKYVDAAGRQIPLYDPLDANGNIIQDAFARPRLQCNGVLNVICPERIDPIAKANMALLPAPDDPTKITNNYRSFTSSESKQNVPSIKGDYVFSDKNRINVLYSRFYTPATPNIGNYEGVPSAAWNTSQKIQYYRINHDYIFKPNLLNHLTLGFNKRHLIENPDNVNNVPEDWAKAVQIAGVTTPYKTGKATRYQTEFVTYGVHVDTDSRQRTTSIKEQLAWLKGSHSVKFGFDYVRVLYRRLDCNDCPGHIFFSANATGNPGVSGRNGSIDAAFLLGLASFGQFNYGADITFQTPYYAGYVQDDIRVNNKLTINIGLRYDLSIPKEERNKNNSNFNPTLPNPGAGGLLGATEFAGDGPGRSGKDRFGETKKNAFGPRLGIAYQLNAKTVIRTGGSVYYQPTREDANADRGTAGFGGWFYSPTDYLAPGIGFTLKNGFNQMADLVSANKPPVIDPSLGLYSTPYYFFPQAGRSPYFTDYMFTVENSVTSNSVARISYHANLGHKLLSRVETLNQLDPKYLEMYGTLLGRRLDDPLVVATGFKPPYAGYPMSRTLQQALRPYPQFDKINTQAGGMNGGHMTYHALETSFEHRFSHGLYLLGSYTFCKLITNVDGESGGGAGLAQNTYNIRAEKSVATQDTPHNLRISYVYEMPIGKGKQYLANMHPVANAILGNWKISALHTYVSGTAMGPFLSTQEMFGATGIEPSVGATTAAVGLGTRASFAPGAGVTIPLRNPDWSDDPAVAYTVPYLNRAAFRIPANMEYGDTPRKLDYLRNPWTVNEDISILKSFAVSERKYFEFRVSASNALNRVLFASPNTNINSPDFGRITQPQGNTPREIQLGLKFYF